MTNVTVSEQEYLWEKRIPAGTCTLIGGFQGATKNLFAYDMIARVTTGKPWPDDLTGTYRKPQNVILLEAEEHKSSSIAPRLIAAGADSSRVWLIEGATIENSDRTRMVSIQRDADGIEAVARREGNVGLIVISPITSYLGEVEQNRAEQVRNEILEPLKGLAERLSCAVVLLKHPNKEFKCSDPLQRIAGSAAFTEAMRAIVWIGSDPRADESEKNPVRAAFWCKFSLDVKPEPLAWRVAVDGNGHPGIMYETGPVGFNARQCLDGRTKKESPATVATEWILSRLAESGATPVGALLANAMDAISKGAKFSLAAFKQAKTDLKKSERIVIARKPGTTPAEWWVWEKESWSPEWYVATVDSVVDSE